MHQIVINIPYTLHIISPWQSLTGGKLIFFHYDVNDAITELTVKFPLQLLFQVNNGLNAGVFFKRKVQIDPNEISAFMGIDRIELSVTVIVPGQYTQYYHLLLFRECLIR
jgi:hypothetical protein